MPTTAVMRKVSMSLFVSPDPVNANTTRNKPTAEAIPSSNMISKSAPQTKLSTHMHTQHEIVNFILKAVLQINILSPKMSLDNRKRRVSDTA
jgi:hypothetical protein